jgi:hypothetical protein
MVSDNRFETCGPIKVHLFHQTLLEFHYRATILLNQSPWFIGFVWLYERMTILLGKTVCYIPMSNIFCLYRNILIWFMHPYKNFFIIHFQSSSFVKRFECVLLTL